MLISQKTYGQCIMHMCNAIFNPIWDIVLVAAS